MHCCSPVLDGVTGDVETDGVDGGADVDFDVVPDGVDSDVTTVGANVDVVFGVDGWLLDSVLYWPVVLILLDYSAVAVLAVLHSR